MVFLFLFFYFGFSLSLLSTRFVSSENTIPWWIGGSLTPHGAFLNRASSQWIVFIAWFAALGGFVEGGIIAYLPALTSIGIALLCLLYLSGFVALSFRLSSFSDPNEISKTKDGSIPNYDRFRIFCATAAEYAKLCQQPDISSRLSDTPYTFLKELPKAGLRSALKIIPNLLYQPVVKEITERTDEYLSKHREEVDTHAEKSLSAQSEKDLFLSENERLKEKIDLLEKSEAQARKDLERMQTRNRTVASKNFTEMSMEELKMQRAAMLEEMRKIDQVIRTQQPATVKSVSLPSINP